MEKIIASKINESSKTFDELKSKLKHNDSEELVQIAMEWIKVNIPKFPQAFQNMTQEDQEQYARASAKLLIQFLDSNSNKSFEKMVTDVFFHLKGIWNSLDNSAKQFAVLAPNDFPETNSLEMIVTSALSALMKDSYWQHLSSSHWLS